MASSDEETPLLRDTRSHEEVEETPIPWGQFSITLVLQLAEPMSSQVIYPFVPQLIRETGVTKGDDKKVAYYVGIMQSIFFATQALTVLHWSRVSDRIGRKPVLLVGLAGLSLSMFCFGLARSFPALVIARSLNGALNGNIGVVKSMMGELTDSTNVARAFAYQPISWSTGATIGPLIGGALSHPTERFPSLFGDNGFLKKYPYFLPCSIPATFTVVAWLVTLLFLKETNPTGFSFGSLVSRLRPRCSRPSTNSLKLDPGPDITSSTIPDAPPLRALLTRPVLLSTMAYALLSLLDIAYRALQPTFYASPRSLGGLALPPSVIGIFLAILGMTNGIFQVGCFARLTKKWGNKWVYLLGIACAAPIFALFPAMSAIVRAEDGHAKIHGSAGKVVDGQLSPLLISLVVIQLALTLPLNMCYGSVFIFITAAASAIPVQSQRGPNNVTYPRPAILSSSSSTTLIPSTAPSIKDLSKPRRKQRARKGGRRTLGAVNGLAQCTVSIMRCVGPYTASALFAKGLAWEYGKDAGSGIPGGGGPVADPMPEGVLGFKSQMDIAMIDSMSTQDGGDAWLWRRLGGLMVYAVMTVLVGITLYVGSKLPEMPWSAAEEAEEDLSRDIDTEVSERE